MISKATFTLTKFRARVNSLLKDAIIATLVFALCCTMTGGAFTTSAAVVREKKGEKNFKQGMRYEQMQKWEQAAQEFALAVAADPANIEYQLHYRRSIFNASQTFMLQGRALAERADYVGAYNAFRQAYGYDQANELALSEMDRMLRLQREATGGATTSPNGAGTPSGGTGSTQTPPAGQTATITPTDYARPAQEPANPSPRTEQRRIINYSNVDLESVIRNLAEQVELNVLFDRDFPKRTITINLRDVTTAQALDYIFLAQGLFFQKLSRRTILVADQSKRPQFQQMQIRTFYLSNIAPEDARTVITQVVPPQPGRNSLIAVNKTTNSLTVRDTPEYIRLIGEVIKSIDKDRAEVVMDVSIYEVSRSDLLQFGNQIGNETSLTALGGSGAGSLAFTAADIVLRGGGAALVFPTSQLIALQRKDHTRLVASTQVHAFDGEASEARIGQRVPVQTAQTFPYTGANTQTGNTTGGVNPGIGFAGGIPVFTYEPTGLTLNFTPQVFPNLDVQVKMSIESKEVFNPGATPTFTERTIKGTARIQNNRTMMLASVAQNRESNGRQGLPLLGLIPIIGRLFTAPRRDNAQTDIVIAVTPRVLRAPAITPRDEEPFGSGSQQTPISEPLETMLIQAEREEQLASARQLPRNVQIELPPAAPVVNQAANNQTTSSPATNAQSTTATNATTTNTAASQPSANAVKTSAANSVASNSSVNNAPASNTLVSTAQTAAPPSYIPAPDILLGGANQPTVPKSPDANSIMALPRGTIPTAQTLSLRLNEPAAMMTALTSNALPAPPTLPVITSATSDAAPSNQTARNYTSAAELRLVPEQQEMRVGERRRLMMVVKTDAPLGVVVSTLRFDPRLIAIRQITSGTMLASGGGSAATSLTQSIDPKGFALVSVAPPNGATQMSGVGVLFVIEIEALAPGTGAVSFLTEDVHLVATDGREIKTRAAQSKIVINQ